MDNVLAEKYPIIYMQHYSWDEDEDEEDEGDEERWRAWRAVDAMLKASTEVLPDGIAYLNSRMHDSWVMSYERTPTDFVIKLNDIQSHCFCEAITWLKGDPISHRDAVLPVEMIFEEVRQFAVCHVNKNGKVLPINTKRFLPFLKTFLCDHVCEVAPDSIRLGMLFCAERKVKRDNNLVLELEAGSLRFQEHQRDAFIFLCGEEQVEWFDLCMEARRKGEKCFDFSSAVDFLREKGFPCAQKVR